MKKMQLTLAKSIPCQSQCLTLHCWAGSKRARFLALLRSMTAVATPAFRLPLGPMRVAAMVLSVLIADSSRAATMIVRDAATIQLGDITYRLDGIDAPDVDQLCIDGHADPWTCGVEARE